MKSSNFQNVSASKVVGIQFSILSPEEIRNGSVAKIDSKDTYVTNKPVIGGIFDPRMGVGDPGMICPTDGLDYMQSPGYFGHLELAKPVFYIQFLGKALLKIVKSGSDNADSGMGCYAMNPKAPIGSNQ